MTKNVVCVSSEQSILDVKHIYEKKEFHHHIPVVDHKNMLTGLITKTNILAIKGQDTNVIVAKDIMVKDIISVDSETSIEQANSLMLKHKIGCLPILELGELVGILTKNDLDKLVYT